MPMLFTWLRSNATPRTRRPVSRSKSARERRGKPWLEVLEDRTVLSTVTWTGAGGHDSNGSTFFDWDNASNWKDDNGNVRLPGATDDAVINTTGITVQHIVTRTDTVNTLTSNIPIQVFTGILSFVNASTISASLTLSGGRITGAGNLTVSGAISWTGGNMEGAGHTVANGGMTLGTGGSSAKVLDSGRTVDNNGTATWTGGDVTMNNGSTWNNNSGGTLDAQSDNKFTTTAGTALVFNNAGLVKKSAGSATTEFDGTFTNTGTLNPKVATINLNNPFSNGGTVTIATGATLTVSGSYTQTAGTTTVDGTLTPTGSVSIQAGLLAGSGTVHANVTNAATVGPGDSPGILTINGTYTQTSAGALNIEIGGTTAGTGFDQLAISGTATLDGALNISLVNGFQPSAGSTYKILTFTSETGTFATVTGTDAGNGLVFQLHYDPTDVTLSAGRTVTATGTNVSATEGQSFSGLVATFVSSDSNATASQFSASITWGDGSSSTGTITGTGAGNFNVTGSHTYAEEGSDAIAVLITDNLQGGSDTANSPATVADAALTPVASTVHPKEGTSFTGVVGNFRDGNANPDLADFSATIAWGDGATTAGTIASNGFGGFKVTGTHTYAEEGSYALNVSVSDAGGSSTTIASTAAVGDAPLTAVPMTFHPKEGVSFSGIVGNFKDGNSNPDLADFSATIDWGDGTTTTGTIASNGFGGFKVTGTHTYAEEGTDAVNVTVHDAGGSSTVINSSAAVADASLTPVPTTVHPKEGVSFSGIVGNFRDGSSNPDLADFTATIDWGDGTTTAGTIASNGAGGFKVTGTHTYAEEGSYALNVSVSDAGGSSTTIASTAAVADASLTPSPVTVHPMEGTSFSGTVGNFRDGNSNPDLADFSASINWGDGTTTTGAIASNGAGGFKVTGTHTYAEEGSFAITISVTDAGGSSTVVNSTAAVADAPLTPLPVTVNPKEGVSFSTVVGNFKDGNSNPDLADFSASIDWGDGTTTAGTIAANGAGGFKVTGTHTYAEEGTFAIAISVADAGGSSTVVNSSAGVADAPLTASPVTVNSKEGASFSGVVGNFRDGNSNPDLADFSASIDWGDGTTTTGAIAANGAGGFKVTGTHTYAEEGTFAIAISVQDAGGSSTVINSSAVVADASLTPSAVTVRPKEGTSFTAVVGNFKDGNSSPDLADFSATIDWGDGTTTAGTIAANSAGGFKVTGTHTYAEETTYSITVSVLDAGGSSTVIHSTAIVADAPLTPVPSTSNPKEGISFSGGVGNFRDGSTNPDITDFSATINWGDGTTTAGTIASNGFGGFQVSGTHTYAEEGFYTVLVTVVDAGGSSTVIHSTADVADAALHGSATTIHPTVNQSITTRVASFTDANASPDIADFSATIDWGDGATTAGTITANGSGGFDVGGTHTYTSTGTFAITVTIHDAGGSAVVVHSTARVAPGGAPMLPWNPDQLGGTAGNASNAMALGGVVAQVGQSDAGVWSSIGGEQATAVGAANDIAALISAHASTPGSWTDQTGFDRFWTELGQNL
jgi:hypothetical protein